MQVRYLLKNQIQKTTLFLIIFGAFVFLFDGFIKIKSIQNIQTLLFAIWLLTTLVFVWWLLHPREFAIDHQGDKIVLNWVWFYKAIQTENIEEIKIDKNKLLIKQYKNQTKEYSFKNINQTDWQNLTKWLSNK